MHEPFDVVISERLGPPGLHEERLAAVPGVSVRGAPLWTHDDIERNAGDADVVILGAIEPFDARSLGALRACRAVIRRGVGYDNVDLEAATALGIIVANVPDASVDEVSDHALALLLALERQIPALDAATHAGSWATEPSTMQALRVGVRRFRDLSLAIVGFGRIGQALAGKARGIYGAVLAVDPMTSEEVAASHFVRRVTFDEALAAADHFSLHAPLLPSTRHLIAAPTLARMRPGAIVVNTARGGLVDEVAVCAALGNQNLAGVGLDVTEREPLVPGDPLLASSALLTAHSAAWSQTAERELARRSVDEALRIVQGELPESVVNASVLEHPALRQRSSPSPGPRSDL